MTPCPMETDDSGVMGTHLTARQGCQEPVEKVVSGFQG